MESKIKSIIADKSGVNEIDITYEMNFTSDLGLDSLDMVEMITEFELEFNIDIKDRDFENITTVAEAIVFIKNK